MRNQMFVKIIAASQHPLMNVVKDVKPIITLHAHYPRFIHAEVMTHRVFSRNARSSRAVPISRMIEEIKTNPVVPWHWGKNQSGMQAFEECKQDVSLKSIDDGTTTTESREAAWLKARDYALSVAEGFMKAGYHKQIVNRLLEPFMWIDTLITSTEWDNFFALRCHYDAEPHFQDLANMIREAINSAKFDVLSEYDWHMPYITQEEKSYWLRSNQPAAEKIKKKTDLTGEDILLRVSAARCARISYKPFNGEGDIEAELARFDSLINCKPMHASPIEHQAIADTVDEYSSGNLQSGWGQFRKLIEENKTI